MAVMSAAAVMLIVVAAATATMTAMAAMGTALVAGVSMATVMLVSIMAESGGLLSNLFLCTRCELSNFLGGCGRFLKVRVVMGHQKLSAGQNCA
jgi:hypothetical protein